MTQVKQNQSLAHDQSNSPDLKHLGQSAIKLLNEGDAKRGKGICVMTYVIAQAWFTKRFEGIVNAPESFTLEDVATGNGLKRDDGKIDNKKSRVRLNVIAHELFSVPQNKHTNPKTGKEVIEFFNASQKSTFFKALKLVNDLIKLQIRLSSDVLLDEKTNTLMLPQWVFFARPTNVHLATTWEKTKNDIMPIGSYEDMLRNVDKIMIDRKLKDKRGTKEQKDPMVILSENLTQVAGEARRLAIAIEGGKDGLTPALKTKYMNTFLALKKLFDAEEKAEKLAQEKDEKEAKAKLAKAS